MKKEIVNKFLLETQNLEINKSFLLLLIDSLSELILNHHKEQTGVIAEDNAKMIIQMVLSRALHIRHEIEGINYSNTRQQKVFDGYIDPHVVGGTVRSLFELICVFHIVYVAPNTDDEKIILYNLWSIAGLKFRQSFADIVESEENKTKIDRELEIINELEKQIKESEKYMNFPENYKNVIDGAIRRKTFQIHFFDNKIRGVGWQDILDLLSNEVDIFKSIYTYLSLQAHPSEVSVFQFRDMFKNGGNDAFMMMNVNVRIAINLICLFTYDYLKVFPNSKPSFENLPLLNQILINLVSSMRGREYMINNSASKIVD